jgi:hypothetical protein
MSATQLGIPAPRPGSAPAPTREKTPSSGRYRLAAGSHPRDAIATCVHCGNICSQRFDGTLAIQRDGEMFAADQVTCTACKQTYFANYIARPDLTLDDEMTILERREPSAQDLRVRIGIADVMAENARLRGDHVESTARAVEAFAARRELFKIERECGRETP